MKKMKKSLKGFVTKVGSMVTESMPTVLMGVVIGAGLSANASAALSIASGLLIATVVTSFNTKK